MFRHPAWAVGSYSSGPLAAWTIGTKSTGGCSQQHWSPRSIYYSRLARIRVLSCFEIVVVVDEGEGRADLVAQRGADVTLRRRRRVRLLKAVLK